ncbi:MAG TPA: FAD-dependent oxidoreductase, partial [Terricaulis sp.]|nr:FAD-dependent oxidoreductase [Terricaulis sp.]
VWRQQPFTLGSYAAARVGQYTTLLENTATPSSDGRIHFAGEHTSIDFLGFMNGAVESGERVAAEILA